MSYIFNDKNVAKMAYIYYCEKCDYGCNKKYNYNKHLDTAKHKIVTNTDINIDKVALKKFTCECGKNYKHRQNLFTHRKKCNFKNENIIDISNNDQVLLLDNSNIDYKTLIFQLINENKEFKDLIIKQQDQIGELIPKVGNNNNNTNNINQKFNVQIFLNEKCKDAINMNEFIKSIEISLQQLDITKNKGLVNGLSNAIVENMNKLSLYKRPLHCTDTKRETLYIKNDDVWEKDKDKTQIKQAIKDLSHKQYKTLFDWTKDNPDFKNNDNKQQYFAKALSAIGKQTENINDKVIKNICSNYYLKDDLPNNNEE